MNLKDKVRKTLLITPDVKEKILSIKGKLPEELEIYLSTFFSKYEQKEKNIIDDILTMVPIMYLKTIQEIEKKNKEKEEIAILELEQQIENL